MNIHRIARVKKTDKLESCDCCHGAVLRGFKFFGNGGDSLGDYGVLVVCEACLTESKTTGFRYEKTRKEADPTNAVDPMN